MNVLVSGASGLVGSALVRFLARSGNDVCPLTRGRSSSEFWWEPSTGEINAAALHDWKPEAFIHLAGENIAGGRWTADRKIKIQESRVQATERLAGSLMALEYPPRILIGASAIGYYGDRGDEILTEASPPGTGFLSEVCRGWEGAAQLLKRVGTRVVHLRFGMILSKEGGALARMLPIFKLGLGGHLGRGTQWVSWIARTDVVRIIHWALMLPSAQGVYNAVTPNPITNETFTRSLARSLHRPAILPVPRLILKLAFGEMAEALLLSSLRAIPERLLSEEFKFEYPELSAALESGD